jgi:hypothetical protein
LRSLLDQNCGLHHLTSLLSVTVFLPFIKHRPWQLKHTPKNLGMERKLQGMWEGSTGPPGNLLHELWLLPKCLDSMLECMVWWLLQVSPGRWLSCTLTSREQKTPLHHVSLIIECFWVLFGVILTIILPSWCWIEQTIVFRIDLFITQNLIWILNHWSYFYFFYFILYVFDCSG